jgi:hypothetical protein
VLNARIRALALKDLRLHAVSFLMCQLSILAIGAAAIAFWPDRPQEVLVSFLFMMNFVFAAYWGDWLVSREKLKGTSAWLRSLPVTDFDLVTSKLVAQGLCIVGMWVLSTGLFVWQALVYAHPGTWIVLLLALLAFGALSLACRWRFRQKLGQVLPVALVFVLVSALMLLDRVAPAVARPFEASWSAGTVKIAVAVALAACYGGTWWATVAWMRRSDTSRLVE